MSLVRRIGNHNPLLMSENELMLLMMERPGSKQWDNMHYLQNYIVTHKSLAEQLIHKYIAPIDFAKPEAEIRYTLRQFEADEVLKATNIYRYAEKICSVIGYYMAKVHMVVWGRVEEDRSCWG